MTKVSIPSVNRAAAGLRNRADRSDRERGRKAVADAVGRLSVAFIGRAPEGRILDGILKYLGLTKAGVYIGLYKSGSVQFDLIRLRPKLIVAFGKDTADSLHSDLWRLGAIATILTNVPVHTPVTMYSMLPPSKYLDPRFQIQVKELKKIHDRISS